MMRSLRTRLFVVLLGAIAVAWMVLLAVLAQQFSHESSGWRDRSLGDIGRNILLSMPSDVRLLSGAANLRLGDAVSPATGKVGKVGNLAFQIWIKPRREVVMRAPGASAAPLKPDFADGYAMRTINGEEWRVYAVSDAHNEVQVQVGKPTADLAGEIRKWVRVGLVTTLLVLLVLGVAIKLVIRWSLKPVIEVREAIAARDRLDLTPLPGGGLPDEVRPLIESFNQLLARLDRAMRNERQFLAEAAHELRTPLAALLTHAQVAQRSKTLDEAKAPLRQLVHGVERSARLSQQLLDSARLDAELSRKRTTIELADIVAVVTHELGAIATQKCQSIALDAEPCAIAGNIDDLGILIGNLIDNAIRYAGGGGRIAVRCLRVGDTAQLQVFDDGPGVAAADRERIFDRFFRVAGSNQRGSGLGLSLVARIAASHGATIATGDGLDGRGFGITVSFPLLPEPSRTPDARSTATRTAAASMADFAARREPAHE